MRIRIMLILEGASRRRPRELLLRASERPLQRFCWHRSSMSTEIFQATFCSRGVKQLGPQNHFITESMLNRSGRSLGLPVLDDDVVWPLTGLQHRAIVNRIGGIVLRLPHRSKALRILMRPWFARHSPVVLLLALVSSLLVPGR